MINGEVTPESTKTFHVGKFDCFSSSRVMGQSSWDQQPFYLHRSKRREKMEGKESHLSLMKMAMTLVSLRGKAIFVFHAQSSLPYIVVARLISFFSLRAQVKYVYDIHDLNEQKTYSDFYRRVRYGVIRHYLLHFLEALIFQDQAISKITVSEGLSEVLFRRFKSAKPIVVHSISLKFKPESYSSHGNEHDPRLVYFGTKNHAPIDLMSTLRKHNYQLRMYGRDISWEELSKHSEISRGFVEILGPYDPKDMDFLYNYNILLLYRPKASTINYQVALPNKLFQALSAGLSLIISSNFVEVKNLFAEPEGAVEVIHNNEELQKAIERVLLMRRDSNFQKKVKSKLLTIYEKSKCNYLTALSFNG